MKPHPHLLLFPLALMLLAGCRAGEVIATATTLAANGGNLPRAVESLARQRIIRYTADPTRLLEDLVRFEGQLARFLGESRRVWGPANVPPPRPRHYVKYTHNYLSRAEVDFDQGWIRVETLDTGDPTSRLREAIVTTLLTPDDPRGVEMFSAAPVKLEGEPFLHRQVVDHEGQPIAYPWRAERFARHLLATALQQDTITHNGGARQRHFVVIPLTRDHLARRAAKYRELVNRHAAEQGLNRSLVYAVIRAESNFNHLAVSHVPAFGLMQIVPRTAGSEMFPLLHGEPGTPSQAYLFDPENNIRMGSAYLARLQNHYLAGVGHPTSREYCAIAAYNGGISRLLGLFHPEREEAVARINALSPAQLHQRLRQGMPEETRTYLQRVITYQREFVGV